MRVSVLINVPQSRELATFGKTGTITMSILLYKSKVTPKEQNLK